MIPSLNKTLRACRIPAPRRPPNFQTWWTTTIKPETLTCSTACTKAPATKLITTAGLITLKTTQITQGKTVYNNQIRLMIECNSSQMRVSIHRKGFDLISIYSNLILTIMRA